MAWFHSLRCSIKAGAFTVVIPATVALSICHLACGEEAPSDGYEAHDMRRPQPPAVTPGTPSTPDAPGKAPSDAVILFDGTDLSKWKPEKGDGEPKWKVENGVLQVVPRSGAIQTKDQFADVQVHAEWRHPSDITGESQARGNSGIFLMGMYELQVLDNYKAQTYPDGMVGGLYGQYPPLVNAALPPGEWQTYDITFHKARGEGERSPGGPG